MNWKLGKIKITLIREVLRQVDPTEFYPNSFDPQAVDGNRHWLEPHFLDSDGKFPLSIHAYVLESEGQTIMVDTCLGNRPIPGIEMLSNIGEGFLANLAQAGYDPDDIDTVVCTHLHFDHVGWNTVWRDSQWVPTFPQARYLFGRREYEFWAGGAPGYAFTFGDTVQPVMDAGLADLVDSDHRITGEVRLEPTPGHTPGHASVSLRSEGQEAVITGDMVHHPIQFVEPDWVMSADDDPQMAAETRKSFVQRYGDSDTTIFGTHFGGPSCGHLRTGSQGCWEFRALD